VSTDKLVEARLAAHWAAQIVSAAGATLSPPESDASHTSLVWIEEPRAVASAALEPTSCRAALRLVDLHLLVLDRERKTVAELALNGRTLAESTSWLSAQIAHARAKPAVDLVRPDHDLPDHPVAQGRAFDAPAIELEELARWFSDAWQILTELAGEAPDAPSVRIWPHHFDTAFLLPLSGDDGSRSIGVGMSPGDRSYAEPYWYVTPWPYPTDSQGLLLDGGGTWHDQGWFGAVLRASSLAGDDEGTRRRRVNAFLRSAMSACRKLLSD
jgi:hypothetical protein